MALSWSSVSSNGKRAAEFVVEALLRRELRRFAHDAGGGGDPDQPVRHLADALLHLRLARLPGPAAELVELNLGILGAVARQKLDILHRQEQAIATGIMDLEAIMRRAGGPRLSLRPMKRPDAVIGMHDHVARGERGNLGENVLRFLAPAPRAHEAIAENVLLADHRDIARLEAGFDAPDREADLGPGKRLHLVEPAQRPDALQPVIGQHVFEPLARALRPGREHDLAAIILQVTDMRDGGIEDVGALRLALGGEAAALTGAAIDNDALCGLRRGEGGQHAAGALAPLRLPFIRREIKCIRRQRAIGGDAGLRGFHRGAAGLVIIADLRQPLAGGFLGEAVEDEGGRP